MELIAYTDLNLLGIGLRLILRSQDVLSRTSLVAVATVCLVLAVAVAAVAAIATVATVATVAAIAAVHAVGPVCLVLTLCAVLTRGTTVLAPLPILEISKHFRSLSLSCVNGKTRHLSILVSYIFYKKPAVFFSCFVCCGKMPSALSNL